MRFLALAMPLALLGLAGCSTGPESYASMTTTGVGFGDYQRYLRERESGASRGGIPYSVPPETRQQPILPPATMPAAAPTTLDTVPLRPRPAAPAPVAAPVPVTPVTVTPLASQSAQQSMPVIPGTPMPAAPTPIAGTPLQPVTGPATTVVASAPAAAPATTFGATPVAAGSDAPRPGVSEAQIYHAGSLQRVERGDGGPAPAQIVEVASVPPPAQSNGPNIVAFALSVSHAPGTEVYRRSNPLRWSRWQNACLQYRNQDAAQEAFLAGGGPERDRDNLDPDGDGYACWWDPTPLRNALASR